MVFLFIFCGVMIFMWFALVITYGMGAVQNGIYTLGITLPAFAGKDEDVLAILHDYKVKKRLIHLIGFLTIGLCIPMVDWTSFLIVYIFVWFGALLLAYTKVLKKHSIKLYELKKQKGWLQLTEAEKEAGQTDDDDIYWLTNKRNPKLKQTMQEKRVGFGFELNTSNKVNIGIMVVTGLFVLGLAAFMLKFDLASVTMTKEKESITIEAADMGETFAITDISEVNLLEECPHMSKKHGYNGGKFNFGTFSVVGVGTCEVYVKVSNAMVIQVTTGQNTILFNMDTDTETKEAYNQLKEWMEE